MNLFYDRGNMIEKWICGIELSIERRVQEMKLWFEFGNWTQKLKWLLQIIQCMLKLEMLLSIRYSIQSYFSISFNYLKKYRTVQKGTVCLLHYKKRLISCGNKINTKSSRRWILYYEMLFVLFEQSESITEMHLRPGVQNIKNILLHVQIMLYETVFVSVHCPITFFRSIST